MNAEKLQMYIFNLLPSPSPYPTPIKMIKILMPVVNGMLSFKKHWS